MKLTADIKVRVEADPRWNDAPHAGEAAVRMFKDPNWPVGLEVEWVNVESVPNTPVDHPEPRGLWDVTLRAVKRDDRSEYLDRVLRAARSLAQYRAGAGDAIPPGDLHRFMAQQETILRSICAAVDLVDTKEEDNREQQQP